MNEPKLTGGQRIADIEDAMKAARGLSANTVCAVLDRYFRGVNYRGCGKRYIFQRIAEGLDQVRDNSLMYRKGRDPEYHEYTWRDEWWDRFLEDLKKRPRPVPRAVRKQKQREAEEQKAEQRKKEAEGWTVKMAADRLAVLRREIEPLQVEIEVRRQEQRKLTRILSTLDPLMKGKWKV